jgi:predicted permease
MLFLFILLGVIIRKAGIITQATRGSYNLFLINVTLPAMILHSFLGAVSLDQLAQAGLILLVSTGLCLFSWVLGKIIWKRHEDSQRSTLIFGTMFSNAGNAGLPVVQLVFGDTGIFYASMFLIPVRILMWSLGVSLFIKDEGKNRWKKLLLNPSIVVVFLGLGIMLSGLQLPYVLSTAIKRVGDITGPLAMILIGTTLAELPLRQAVCKEAWQLSFVRLLLLPLLILLVLKLLNMDSFALSIAFVLCAMPVATNTVVLAERFGADYHLASRCVFLSTLLSLFTVPLLTLLL